MKPKNNRVFCIGCHHHKMLFQTQSKADNFIKYNSKDIAVLTGKAPIRSYYCSFCCGWHITGTESFNAKACDNRDEQLWNAIRLKHQKIEQTKGQPTKKYLPSTEVGYQIQLLLHEIDNTCKTAEIAIARHNYAEATTLIENLRTDYEVILALSAQHGINSMSINIRGELITELYNSLPPTN